MKIRRKRMRLWNNFYRSTKRFYLINLLDRDNDLTKLMRRMSNLWIYNIFFLERNWKNWKK